MTISQENLNLAQYIGKVFGENAAIAEHFDEQQNIVVRVLSCFDDENEKIKSYATIGLSDYRLGKDKSGIALGAELVARTLGGDEFTDRALAEVVRAIRGQNLLPKPGIIFANAVSGFSDTCQLKHFLFTVPSMWENKLYPLQFKTKTVLWLQAIPISDAEKQYAEKHGANALGEKMTEAGVDLVDMARKSVL